MNKNNVIKQAEKFCECHNVTSYPVNIVELCNNEGIDVFEAYLKNYVSGLIVIQEENFRDFDTGRLIVVNLKDPASRRRFTIAHELAHYILHKDPDSSLYAHRDIGDSSQTEQEANIFASNILMPKNLVQDALSQLYNRKELYNFYIIEYIANKFAVSKQAAEVRLNQLNEI